MSKISDHTAFQCRGYRFGRKIGEGSFSKVHLVNYEDPQTGGKLVLACKRINKRNSAHLEYNTKFLSREIQIIQQIKHPNIIEVHSIFDRNETLYIFMQ